MMNLYALYLAIRSYLAGPAVAFDSDGNPYWAYVVFLRSGIRYHLLLIDEDIAKLNNNGIRFLRSEIIYSMQSLNIYQSPYARAA